MRSQRFRVFADGIAWVLLLLLLAFGVPRVETSFTDYGIPLPRLTAFTIRASHMWPVFLLLATILLSTDLCLIAKLSGQGDAEWFRSWSAVMIATPLLLIALTLMSLVLPLFTIDTGLSG
jgi:type II secretory pathway component PulF